MSERILYGSSPRCGKTILFEEKRKKEFEKIRKENEQLKVLLKEAEDEIERLKKTKQGLLESIVENDSNNAMILEFISNVRESEMCEGCKHKDKPVEWYLENGLSITEGVCNRYEPED